MHNVVSQGCHRDFLRGRCSLSFNVILDVALFPGANAAVRCERVPAAALGEDVTLKCNFIPSLDVLQVTWQKLEGSSFKNIATYSKAHGTKFIGPFNKRICFNDTSLKASSITLRGVTLEDETCYKCIFNAFPHGSFSRETCLIVQSISAVRTELHSNASSPELLTAVCSATAKPAPEITWKPEGFLIGQPEIHGVKHANGTVTVTSKCNISVRLLRLKNLQALTCVINHPMGRKEKIIGPLEEYEASDEESRIYIWPGLFAISLTAIGVTILILTYKKSKGNKPTSSSMPCTPAEKKNLNQDGGDRHQYQPTPKSQQSVFYQNERQTPGSSQRKRKFFSKQLFSKKNQRDTRVPRSIFSEGKEKNEEGNLNHSFMEGIEEIDDSVFKN
ncbi:OX-2 membrane glycoprotein-like [Trachemys scripta elegans]|uniref:OX-2 membrane glycoprotein-like n=1 Tax=Trachemys scripta elegans TaxID=31138 RepID=UPI00155556CB|nr:OX-2 membrane glycoprotein-like [Trachemys scripta elegans]